MNVALRLGLFGLGLLVTFAVMYVVGRALVPASTVDRWVEEVARPAREHQAMPAETMRSSEAQEPHSAEMGTEEK